MILFNHSTWTNLFEKLTYKFISSLRLVVVENSERFCEKKTWMWSCSWSYSQYVQLQLLDLLRVETRNENKKNIYWEENYKERNDVEKCSKYLHKSFHRYVGILCWKYCDSRPNKSSIKKARHSLQKDFF